MIFQDRMTAAVELDLTSLTDAKFSPLTNKDISFMFMPVHQLGGSHWSFSLAWVERDNRAMHSIVENRMVGRFIFCEKIIFCEWAFVIFLESVKSTRSKIKLTN